MDSQANWAKHVGLTPGKAALVAALALLLVGVLYVQLRGTAGKPQAAVAQPSAETGSSAEPSQGDAALKASGSGTALARRITSVRGNWSAPPVTAIAEFDPFALPASFPQTAEEDVTSAIAQSAAQSAEAVAAQRAALAAEREQAKSQLSGLRQQGVQVIIKRKDQYVAIVGDQELRVGDQINGFTVISIDGDEVYVAKDLSR